MDLTSIVPDRVSNQAKLFLVAAFFNGFGNGIVNVVLQLYLTSLGFGSTDLGTIFMMNPLGAAFLTIPAGILADRYGKKRVMLSGLSITGVAVILVLTAKTIEMFIVSFLLIGLSNATFVILTPLYSSFFDKGDMDRAFGLWGFLNIITMSMGSLFGFIPPMLVSNFDFSLQHSYWTVMAIAGVFIMIQAPIYLMLLRGVVEPKREGGFKFSLKSKGVVMKFFVISIISVVGFGVFFSLFPFYVNRKFGVESDALGTLMFVSNFVSAGVNAVAPRVSKKLGTLKTITASIVLATPFYLMIPMAPNFTWVSAFYIGRLGFRTMADPLTGSLFMRLLYDDEKATANSIRMMALQGGNIAAPWLGGQLMEKASLDFPVYLGTGLYIVFAASYYFLLRNEKEKEVEIAVLTLNNEQ